MSATVSTDIFIAGGGPAGLATAIAAAQRGFSVMLADAGRPPIDKACGEGIMPDGVGALREFGVDLSEVEFFPLEGIRFADTSGEALAHFFHEGGLGLRRTVLHSALAARAESIGVRLCWGTPVQSVRQGEAVAGGQTVRSRYLICADGQNSALRAMAGLGAGKVASRRYGFRRHYRVQPWSPFVEVHWAQCGQLYITPVASDEICVALLTGDSHLRLETALASFPALHSRLSCAMGGAPGRTMGGITATRRLDSVVHGRVALVGDCSGSADAITGDGLSMAFQQARALAAAIRRDSLRDYQAEHERITRVPRAMGELLLLIGEHAKLRSRVFRAFAESPELFARLLAVHTRSLSPAELGVKDCLHFAWRLLCA